jgi:hypothetical protein
MNEAEKIDKPQGMELGKNINVKFVVENLCDQFSITANCCKYKKFKTYDD